MVALTHIDVSPPARAVRRIGMADLGWALREGWTDFRQMRGDILILGFIYPAVGLLAALFAVRGEFLPLLFPLAAGLSILGPAVASGFFELARRREAGLDTSWIHFLDPFRRPSSRAPLMGLTLGLAVLFAAWVGVAWSLYRLTFGPLGAPSASAFVTEALTTPQGWALIVLGNLTGLGFAAVALVVSLVSFPMAVEGRTSALAAVETSLAACARNPLQVAAWGLIVAALLAVASLPLFIGLAVALPVLGYASWRLYTRLVGPA